MPRSGHVGGGGGGGGVWGLKILKFTTLCGVFLRHSGSSFVGSTTAILCCKPHA